ncbi:MAG: DUF3140 domain-containing protein [Candidatus Velthaea sp.]|jgi:hypothetical protein
MTTRASALAEDPITAAFAQLVNMTPHELEAWLQADQSREVGAKPPQGGESTGHASGRHIVKILRKKKGIWNDADLRAMHRVVGSIKRHLAQRPSGDVHATHWADSLKNWGHDPLKVG